MASDQNAHPICAAVIRLLPLAATCKKRGHMTRALFIATVFAWGTSWYALHFQLGYALVEVSICYRFGLGSLLLGLILVMTGRLKPVAARVHLYLSLLGFCFFGFNFFLMYNSTAFIA